MTQLRPHAEEFAALNIQVLVVTFQPLEVAEQYVAETNMPWPLLVDESRSLYAAMGMARGSVWNVAGPAVWVAGLKSVFRHGAGIPSGDPLQLAGTFVIDHLLVAIVE